MIYVALSIVAFLFILILIYAYDICTSERNNLIKNLEEYAEKEKAKQFKSKIQKQRDN
tara:strand:- start:132 stop:305 length:174 start_codon:yes stop_codon:yes gene_type:complete